MPSMDELKEALLEIWRPCEEQGMQLPFITCAVSPNGSVLAVRVNGDGSGADTLAEHYETEGFSLPMTFAIIDQRNEAVTVTLEASGEKVWHLTSNCPAPGAHSSTATNDARVARSYSITSLANSVIGKVSPSAWAVFKLIISSIFVDCWIGRSAGFSPLRIRPT